MLVPIIAEKLILGIINIGGVLVIINLRMALERIAVV